MQKRGPADAGIFGIVAGRRVALFVGREYLRAVLDDPLVSVRNVAPGKAKVLRHPQAP